MNKEEFAELVEKTIKEGGMLVSLYFDMHGPDPDKLKHLMTEFVAKISVDEGVVYAFGNIKEPLKFEEESETIYSTMVEVYALIQDYYTLAYLSLNYAPVTLDILKPEKEFVLDIPEAQRICARLSHFSQVFTDTYLNKVLTPEDKKKHLEKMKIRQELGKKYLDENLKKGEKNEK
ncbi:hypothetical protein KO465_00570 [Candidatus Micrarchaeota archaeon]|nr:hypothetical protein [Candidatus Micrarchaeota archaeon]